MDAYFIDYIEPIVVMTSDGALYCAYEEARNDYWNGELSREDYLKVAKEAGFTLKEETE